MDVLVPIIVVALIVANGAFVAIEFAAVGARRSSVELAASEGRRGARAGVWIQDDLLLTLTGAQLGITVCSLALGRIGEPYIAHLLEALIERFAEPSEALLHTLGFIGALTIVVVVHTVVGEMVPKNLTIPAPERVLLVLAGPMSLFTRLTAPFTKALNAVVNGMLRLLRVEPQTSLADVATRAELGLMVAESHRSGLIDAEQSALLDGVLRFNDTSAAQAMTPMAEVDAVPVTATVEEIEAELVATGHARLIVFGNDLDDVRGFVHGKDLLAVSGPARQRRLPVGRVRPMIRVDHEASLPEVLQLMRRGRSHLALVVRAGQPHGVLTLDDVFAGMIGGLAETS